MDLHHKDYDIKQKDIIIVPNFLNIGKMSVILRCASVAKSTGMILSLFCNVTYISSARSRSNDDLIGL